MISLVCFICSIVIFSLLKELKGKESMIIAVSRKLFRKEYSLNSTDSFSSKLLRCKRTGKYKVKFF